jgi:hypothetical protein
MTWVSPTSHNDPDSQWTDEANAYDGNTGTSATSGIGAYYLELLHAAIQCDKVRLWFNGGTARFTLDVYYALAWHNLADSGDPADEGQWHEYPLGSIQSVTAARLRFEFGTGVFALAELELNDMGTWKKVAFTDDAPAAHKDSHDPNDGSDALDTAAAGEIVGVAAAAEGTAHSFARSDHTHQIQHSIADNHVVTVDDADAASGQIARFTANGIEGVTAVIATDVIWDAKGDIAVGTGANTASKLTVGANNAVLTAASGEATGLKWQSLVSLLVPSWIYDADYTSTNSTDYGALADMTVTVSIPTTGAKLLLFFVTAAANGTAAKKIFFKFTDTTTSTDYAYIDTGGGHGAAERVPLTLIDRQTGLSAGSHTIIINWKVDGGTADVYSRSFLALVIP